MKYPIKTLAAIGAVAGMFMTAEADTVKPTDFPPLPRPDSECLDVRTSGLPKFKDLYMTPIVGAPVLQQPVFVDGIRREIRTEEHGLAYPTVYDWNHDGKPDLLVGEFLTGQSRIKVYLNTGTKQKPSFTGEWTYATDVNGDTISNYQWCCIGIHPQIVDINGDGIDDIFSGQYYPGVMSWWQGTKDGFLPRKEIPQFNYQPGKAFASNEDPMWSEDSWEYWNYSSGRVADFNGDGLPDLFVAGNGGYRVALNTGTKDEPAFGRREFLFHVDGTILHTNRTPGIIVRTGCPFNAVLACSGSTHSYLNPVDWDGDGVLDIIATDSYTIGGQYGVYFLRGVRTDDGIRFEQARPLFQAYDGSKALPGCNTHIQVVDFNGDGVKDILMGVSIPTINGFEGAEDLYYRWIDELHLPSPGKDVGETFGKYRTPEQILDEIGEYPQAKQMYIGTLDDWKYVTLRHRGFVVLFEGRRNPVASVAIPAKAAAREFEYDKPAPKEEKPFMAQRKPVSLFVRSPRSDNGNFILQIDVRTTGTYHLYTDAPQNFNQPLAFTFKLPEGFELVGNLKRPPVRIKDGSEIYDGKLLRFEQEIRPTTKPGKYAVEINASWQTCCDDSCLPPEQKTETVQLTI